MIWTIRSYPPCLFHVFLSHTSDDKPWLVDPLDQLLQTRGTIPWYDRRHFPLGVDPYEALRFGILRSRITVYLITLATLTIARGWQALEKAYGGILQDSFRFSGVELSHTELPLFFLPRNDPSLPRTIWQPLVAKGKFHTSKDGPPVTWAADQIVRFVRAEENNSAGMLLNVRQDPVLAAWVNRQPGMNDRIAAHFP